MHGSEIRKHLHEGTCVFGTHITSLPNPNATMLSANMGLDFAFFCTEHLPLDRNEISLLCRFYSKICKVSPIVRVPSAHNLDFISMTLDAGAEGIIIPYAETTEEVQKAASMVKHRPIKGRYQNELLQGTRKLSPELEKYITDFNKNNYLIIGIESVPAIENLEQLITCAEVDSVFLGPHDISTSLGIPEQYEHPLFVSTVENVIRSCRVNKVGVGIHLPLALMNRDILNQYLAAGMNFLINGTDIMILQNAMQSQINTLKQLTNTIRSSQTNVADDSKLKTCLI
ncbi:MAG: HpcH/HpaI aldolase family protein [Chthoniobacterales bacterium]